MIAINEFSDLRFCITALLLLCSQPVSSKTLSALYLSPKDQQHYQHYFQLVRSQSQDTYEDLEVAKRYPVLVKRFSQALEKMTKFVVDQGYEDISYMLQGTKACDDENIFTWGSNSSAKRCEYMGVDWVAPILYHKGDLMIQQSFELDLPLFVDGNLTVKGSLIMKHEKIPLVVTGSLRADNLLYELYMDHYGPHLFVKGSTVLDGYAFMDGDTATFSPRLSCKASYALDLSPIQTDHTLKPFPNKPESVRSGILQYNNFYQENELDLEALEQRLLKNEEVFNDGSL